VLVIQGSFGNGCSTLCLTESFKLRPKLLALLAKLAKQTMMMKVKIESSNNNPLFPALHRHQSRIRLRSKETIGRKTKPTSLNENESPRRRKRRNNHKKTVDNSQCLTTCFWFVTWKQRHLQSARIYTSIKTRWDSDVGGRETTVSTGEV